MTVHISDFGDVLVSRPAGRDAFLGARAYLFPDAGADTEFTLDFDGVKVELYSIVVDGVGEGIEKEVQLCYALATNKNNKGEPLYEYNCNQQRKRCQPGGL